MINLDVCGVGDQIVFGPRKNLTKGLLGDMLTASNLLQKHKARIVDYIPPGDEMSFEREGIPNISIAILPNSEIDVVIKLAEYMEKRQRPQPGEFTIMPMIMETMHNGPRDYTDIVEEGSMKKVLNFLLDAIYSYN
ncbi:MAG TPA: hypothetical protein VIK72_05545 [Clostridiaceae bacterium]